ncbi:MAG: efflux RND transporter permease subunit, partial [bacterium]
ERTVTVLAESALGSLPGVTELRSLTKYGLSQVTVIFEDGTDLSRARQLVAERLGGLAARLPAGAVPTMSPMSTGLGDVVFYAVEDSRIRPGESEARRLMRLRALHDWDIRPQLRTVPGIADVNAIGGHERQLHVLVDHGRLAAAGVSLGEVVAAIESGNASAGGGYIQRSGEQVLVRSVGRVGGAEELGRLPIRRDPLSLGVTIGQVATIQEGSGPRTGAATLDGREAVTGIGMMLIGQNGRAVARRLADRIRDVRRQLPPGTSLRVLYSREDLVNATLRTVRNNMFEGAVFVIAVLFLFLGNWRAALIVASAIPLSMLFAVTGMFQSRISGNLMSLGAIDFGLIVDGAVIVIENCVRHIGARARRLGDRLRALNYVHA